MALRKRKRLSDSQSINADATSPAEGMGGPVSLAGSLSGSRAQALRRWRVVFTLVFSDILLALMLWGSASIFQSVWGRGPLSVAAAVSIVTSVGLWVMVRALLGLYPGYGLDQAEELRRQTYAVLATLAVTAIFALAFQLGDLLSRLLLILGFLGLLLLAPLLRYFVKLGMERVGWWGKPVLVLGADKTGARLIRALHREWGLGFRPVAVFDDRLAPVRGLLESVPYGGVPANAMELATKKRVDTAIIAMPEANHDYWAEVVRQASSSFPYVIVIPHLAEVTATGAIARDLAGTLGVELKHNLLNPRIQRVKRALDISFAVVGGTLILPLFIMLSLVVWLEVRSSVFYRDERLGRDGKVFSCIKFRTMAPDAEARLQQMLKEDIAVREEYLKYHKLRNDPRITRVGRFLRKSSLDELPQLWNVLRGEMSLVGPRPYHSHALADLGPARSEILRVPPGMTGLWQVSGRSSLTFSERVQLDCYYVRNWSIWLDFLILARTIKATVFSRGAY